MLGLEVGNPDQGAGCGKGPAESLTLQSRWETGAGSQVKSRLGLRCQGPLGCPGTHEGRGSYKGHGAHGHPGLEQEGVESS